MYYEFTSRIQLLIERDKLDLAQEKIMEGHSLFPESDGIWALQAEVLYRKEKYKESLEAINKAISINPENDFSFYTKSKIHSSLNDDKQAIESINNALTIDPEYALYYAHKALVLLDMGQLDIALQAANEGIELDPEDLNCNNALSLILSRTGQGDLALERLERTLETGPENTFTHANIGHSHLRSGNIKKAKEHFAMSLSYNPGYEYARSGMQEAIKATNWPYRKLLAFAYWMESFSESKRWMIIIGLMVVVKVVPFLTPFYFVFLFWSWFTGPISDMALQFDKYGIYLKTELEKKITLINLGLVGSAAVSAILAPLVNLNFLGLAGAFFLTIVPVYLISTTFVKKSRWVYGAIAGFFVLYGVAALILTMFFGFGINVWFGLLAAAFISTWVIAALK